MDRPSLEFIVRVNNEPTPVKMTFALFNEIMQVVPNPENIADLLIRDPALREYVIRRMLTGSKRVTKDEDLVDLFEMDVDISDLDDLIVWVGDHVLYFFMNSAAKTAKLGEKYEQTIVQLARSKTGSES